MTSAKSANSRNLTSYWERKNTDLLKDRCEDQMTRHVLLPSAAHMRISPPHPLTFNIAGLTSVHAGGHPTVHLLGLCTWPAQRGWRKSTGTCDWLLPGDKHAQDTNSSKALPCLLHGLIQTLSAIVHAALATCHLSPRSWPTLFPFFPAPDTLNVPSFFPSPSPHPKTEIPSVRPRSISTFSSLSKLS